MKSKLQYFLFIKDQKVAKKNIEVTETKGKKISLSNQDDFFRRIKELKDVVAEQELVIKELNAKLNENSEKMNVSNKPMFILYIKEKMIKKNRFYFIYFLFT
jgi:uncharacterized coiled-coil protein SlyX